MRQIAQKVNSKLLFQFSEQAMTSLGTFIFMVAGARLLGLDSFGIVALYWTIVQMPSVLQFSLVLLPISASRDDAVTIHENIQHAVAVLLALWSLFFGFMPLLFWGVASDQINFSAETFLVIAFWCVFQSLFELVRWLIIRYGDYKWSLMATLVRWALFISGLALMLGRDAPVNPSNYVALNIFGLVSWLAVAVPRLPIKLHAGLFRPAFSRLQLSEGLPQLGSSVTNIVLNYGTVLILARFFSLDALGAFQAIRSVANIFSMMSQFVDNHVTAYLAKFDRQLRLGAGYFVFSAIVGSIVYITARLIDDFAVVVVLSEEFIAYSMLLPPMLCGAVMQLLTRPVATELRLSRNYQAFYFALAINIIIVLPLIVIGGFLNMLVMVVMLYSLSPATLMVVSQFQDKLSAKVR